MTNHDKEQFNLPEDFDFDLEVGSIKFGLMLQYKYGYEKRYNKEVNRIRETLKEHFTDLYYVDKLMNKLILTAERTIPNEFFKLIGSPRETLRI